MFCEYCWVRGRGFKSDMMGLRGTILAIAKRFEQLGV